MVWSRDKQTFVESRIHFSERKVAGLRVGAFMPELMHWALFVVRGVEVFTEAQLTPHTHIHARKEPSSPRESVGFHEQGACL